MNNVTLIAGPGRSGTTFLWRLLKELGFDTGDAPEFFKDNKREAQKGNIPYVVKGTAAMCHELDKYVERWDLKPDHVIVAMRRFESCIDSRVRMRKRRIPSMTKEDIRRSLLEQVPLAMGRLWFHLIEEDYPYTVVTYPESAQDVDYCYHKITEAMGSIPYDKFVEAWDKVVDPKLVRRDR